MRRAPDAAPPTSEEKLALVERAYFWLHEIREATPNALEDAFRECFDQKLDVAIPDSYPEGGQTFRGPEGLQRWTDTTREVWDEWRFEIERLLDAGDRVVALIHVVATGGSSGISLDRRTAHIWSVEDRRLTRCEVHLDRSEALAAAGLEDERKQS
jgi:ketosteroid isomerase-like protein